MTERRWFNSRLPQTLVISQFLLYFNAFWLVLGVIGASVSSAVSLDWIGRLLLLGSLAINVYGAYGIANEMKRGYQVAVLAAFSPILVRLVIVLIDGSLSRNVPFVLVPGGIINALFVYALIALLLHPQSREHQKIWFS